MNKTKLILTIALYGAWASISSLTAAYTLTDAAPSITETFTDYAGTAAPENWVLNAPHRDTGVQALYQGTTNNNVVGWRSYGASESSERALGFLGNSNYGGTDENPATMTASFLNQTSFAITSFSIAYTGEQWYAQEARNTYIKVSYSLDGTNFSEIPGLRFDVLDKTNSGVVDGNSNAYRTVFSPTIVDLTSTPVGTGDTLYLRFSYYGGNGSLYRQGLGIDDVSIHVVPEPSVAALIFTGLALLGMQLMHRRRI